MTALKFAFRNLVRLPYRTVLYFVITFFLVLSVSASLFVYVACENAEEAFNKADPTSKIVIKTKRKRVTCFLSLLKCFCKCARRYDVAITVGTYVVGREITLDRSALACLQFEGLIKVCHV